MDADDADLRRWNRALQLGFLLPEPSEESYAHTLACWRADRPTFIGAYRKADLTGAPDDLPVATFGWIDRSVNTGGGHLEAARFLTDVTVRTTSRRRGLLRRLMVDALADAQAAGVTLSALTASEGSIYGRFGFGVATRHLKAELTTGGRFALTHPVPERVDLVPSDAVANVRRQVFDAFHRSHRGSHDRLAFYEPLLSGTWDFDAGAPNPRLRTAVHYDPQGVPDGIVVWSFDADTETVSVKDLLAVNAAAELGLWQFLGSIDLVAKVTITRLSPTSPLPWVLTDPRLLKATGGGDFTWLRVLDVVGALGVRSFEADGDVSFVVDDPLGLTPGAYRLRVVDGRAEVVPLATEPALRLDVRALGSLYFGVVDAVTLAAGGLITGPDADVTALARLFRTAEPPHNAAGF